MLQWPAYNEVMCCSGRHTMRLCVAVAGIQSGPAAAVAAATGHRSTSVQLEPDHRLERLRPAGAELERLWRIQRIWRLPAEVADIFTEPRTVRELAHVMCAALRLYRD